MIPKNTICLWYDGTALDAATVAAVDDLKLVPMDVNMFESVRRAEERNAKEQRDAAWRAQSYAGVTVGASGAFYGIAYAWARTFPHRTVLMMLVFPVQAKWFVLILIAMDFAIAASSRLTSGVSHVAHFAGLAAGYLYLNGGLGGGPGGIGAEIKYRYLRWKMGRARSRFDVYSGGRSADDDWKSEWKKHIH